MGRLRTAMWFGSFRKLLRREFGIDPASDRDLSKIGVLTPRGIMRLGNTASLAAESMAKTLGMEKTSVPDMLYALSTEGKVCVIPDDPHSAVAIYTDDHGDPRTAGADRLGTSVELAAAVRGAQTLAELSAAGKREITPAMTEAQAAKVREDNTLVDWIAHRTRNAAKTGKAAKEAVKSDGEIAAEEIEKEAKVKRERELEKKRREEEEYLKLILTLIYDRLDGIDMSAPRTKIYMNAATVVRCARAGSIFEAMGIAAKADEEANAPDTVTEMTYAPKITETFDAPEPFGEADADEPSEAADEYVEIADAPVEVTDVPVDAASVEADEPAEAEIPSPANDLSAILTNARADAFAKIKTEHIDPASEEYLDAVGVLIASETVERSAGRGELAEKLPTAQDVSAAGKRIAGTKAFAEAVKKPFVRAKIALLHTVSDEKTLASLVTDISKSVEEQAKKEMPVRHTDKSTHGGINQAKEKAAESAQIKKP